MATSIWGIGSTTEDALAGLRVDAPFAAGDIPFSVADSGGTELAVAYVKPGATSVFIDFFDEQALPSAARTPLSFSAAPGATITNVAISASGVLGYGVSWTEQVGTSTTLYARYVGPGGFYGDPRIVVAAGDVADIEIAGYSALDTAGKRAVSDGFEVVWKAADGIHLARYSVALDAAKDPTGAVTYAGLDGLVGTADDTAASTLIAAGDVKDPSLTVSHNGDTVVAWIEGGKTVNFQVITAAISGTAPTIQTITATLPPPALPAVAPDVLHVDTAWLAAGTMLVGWSTSTAVFAVEVIVAPGTAQVVAASNVHKLYDGAVTDFSLGTMLDLVGGFTLTFNEGGSTKVVSYDPSFAALDQNAFGDIVPVVLSGLNGAADLSSASLIGDRVFVAGLNANGDLTSQVVDPRTLGLLILGDNTAAPPVKALPDVLVGTTGNDTIDGLAGSDILDGAMGNDQIKAGIGDDVVDGGGGTDTVVFGGKFADYNIQFLGRTLFQVNDTRAASGTVTPDGLDLIRNVETFRFAFTGPELVGQNVVLRAATLTEPAITGTVVDLGRGLKALDVATTQLDHQHTNITPTAWGLTQSEVSSTLPDGLPQDTRQAHVDGFVVNDGTTGNDRAGNQSAPVIADSVGQFVSIMWEDHKDGGSRIRASFLDVLSEPDTGTPLPANVNVTDGIGHEHGIAVASGGANSGWGFAFLEDDAAVNEGRSLLKTNFFGLSLTGTEQYVDYTPGQDAVTQHDAAVFGSFLDRRAFFGPDGATVLGPDAILPAGMNEGYNVAYVETTDQADDRYGVVKLQRYEAPLDALGNPGAPVKAGRDGLAGVTLSAPGINNPDGTQIEAAEDTSPIILSTYGRNPSVTGLHTFETVVTWIAPTDGTAGGPEGVYLQALNDMGNDIFGTPTLVSGTDTLADGTNAMVASAGAVNAGVVWVADVGGKLEVHARMYSSGGAGLNGDGFGFGASEVFTVMGTFPPAGPGHLDATVDLASLRVSGMSGEDSNDLILTWTETNGSGDRNIFAQHVAVFLDPTTGVAIAMQAEGATIMVNTVEAGQQDHVGVAGLLSDRFITVWQDDGTHIPGDTGTDIIARVFDTRDPAGGELFGDNVTPRGTVQARRDIIVGTVGNDTIHGDLSDSVGLTDEIYGGMGDDVLIGGPGLKGAAGVAEIIDGGEGIDTSVYTGNRSDYTITAIFDPGMGAGYEIVDKRAVTAGSPHDGVDNVFNVEKLQFADRTMTTGQIFTPPKPGLGAWDGTLTQWSLTDTADFKPVLVSGGRAAQSQIAVTNLQDDAAMVWVQREVGEVGDHHIYGVRYDITGTPDPLWANGGGAGPQEMTDGSFVGNTVKAPVVAMAGGLGFVGAWLSNDGVTDTVHVRFGSTATDEIQRFDPATPLGYGWAGREIVIPGSENATSIAVQGYEIVNSDNDTLEYGFHVAFTTAAGDIKLARYEIPVYDLDPVTNLRTTPASPTSFGKGAETEPRLIGNDGVRGLADSGDALKLVGHGSSPSFASLHDGQLVLSYVDDLKNVQVKVIGLTIDQTADRSGGGADPVTGLTTYDYDHSILADVPPATGKAETAHVVAQQNGSFAVFWSEAVGSTYSVFGKVYSGAAPSWQSTPVMTYETGLSSKEFSASSGGVNGLGLEAGFVLTWSDGHHIYGQNFDMTGTKMGIQFSVDDPTKGGASEHSGSVATGVDNGLVIVGYQDTSVDANGDAVVTYLDTRQPGDVLIGPRNGALANVFVGTTGDDAMDGRNRADIIYGGLGNDVITLGGDADFGDGGAGNDYVLGGSGQDQILGGLGNDYLMGGGAGPVDPQTDRDFLAGLNAAVRPTAFNVAQWNALIASDPGADMVSGGEDPNGLDRDTISYKGEITNFRIDLASGVVLQESGDATAFAVTDNGVSRNYVLDAAIGALVDDGAGGTIFQFTADIENAEGGLGDDVLIGDAGNNVLTGGGGNDFIDGRGGAGDVAVIFGDKALFTVSRSANGVTTTVTKAATADAPAEVTTLTGVEFIQFTGAGTPGTAARIAVADIAAGSVNQPVIFGARLDINGAIVAVADTLDLAKNRAGNVAVLANDINPDLGQSLTLTQINGVAFTVGVKFTVGVGLAALDITVDAFGSVRVKPVNANFVGSVPLTYTVSDGQTTAQGSLTVNVGLGHAATGSVVLSGSATAADVVSLTSTSTVADVDAVGGITRGFVSATSAAGPFGGFVAGGTLAPNPAAPTVYAAAVQYNDTFAGLNTQVLSSARALVGTAGSDALSTTGVDFVFARAGDDTITFDDTTRVGVVIDGGTNGAAGDTLVVSTNVLALLDTQLVNVETVSAAAMSSAVTINLGTQTENLKIIGGSAADVITAGSGNDTLVGGAGLDTLSGGAGNDLYVLGADADTINDASGIDTVETTRTSYALSAGLENLVYTGAATPFTGTGNALNNSITGGAGADILSGGAGNDTLVGGLGNDQMSGGDGNDLYIVTESGDVVTELSAAVASTADEVDTTLSSYTLGANVEILKFIGAGAFIGNGNALNNLITGGSGADVLNGFGGNDTMVGGEGGDIYNVDSIGDVVTETGLTGRDKVISTVAYTLGATIEDLDLSGNGSINGTGNALDNVITDAGGKNGLSGLGGNDTFVMTNDGQQDDVDGGAGIDTISYALFTAGVTADLAKTGTDKVKNVENVIGGSGNDTINGDGLDNVLAGGAGNDVITGGAGRDTFIFNTALNGTTNVDRIVGYSVADDTMQLSKSVFAGLDANSDNKLDANHFNVFTANAPSNTGTGAQLWYNTTTGDLYFDADGSGASAAVKFANVTGNVFTTANAVGEFTII